jgi:acetyl-CoA carboxylase biotin carboxyl carrier protein
MECEPGSDLRLAYLRVLPARGRDSKRSHRKRMNQKELKELIEFLIEKDIAEFELERGDVKVKIKRAGEHTVVHSHAEPRFFAVPPATTAPIEMVAAPPVAPPPTVAGTVAPAPEEGLHTVKSPIVGTFYEAPSPGAPPFVKAGDSVEVGQVLCIVEAMKLLNEIESDVAGEIVKKLATNGQPIEYGQELFVIRPKK